MQKSIQTRIRSLLEEIDEYIYKKNSINTSIKILAVSKKQPIDLINYAYLEGINTFGENRIQETVEKYSDFANRDSIQLHLIGSLQSNKVKKALQLYDCIQSVDRIDIISTLIKERKKQLEFANDYEPFPLYLQVKCYQGDNEKFGITEYDILKQACEYILQEQDLFCIKGLMTIGPNTNDEYQVRTAFAETRKWKEKIQEECCLSQLELSMGMSNDYLLAIEEGATMIRIGSKIFGDRIGSK